MPQDPAAIQRQIEITRAELAETIDAIAEIVSPKRVAKRAGDQLKVRVEELRQRAQPSPDGTVERPALPSGVHRVTATRRTVRWDRVAIAAGAVVLIVVLRRRRARRRAARGAEG